MGNREPVWVFNGAKGRFPSAVFSTKEKAEAWIHENRLCGMLTAYPMDVSVYDWAVQNGCFTPKEEKHRSSEFIGGFSSASQEHYHYENDENE